MTDPVLAVSNLIGRYAELIDDGDFDGVADLLADAAVGNGDAAALLSGREAIRSLFTTTTRRYANGTPGTKHVTTNLIVEMDEGGESVRARSYFTVLQSVPGLPLQPIVAGRYHDKFQNLDGRWRFSERRFFIDLVGDMSRHLVEGREGNRSTGSGSGAR